MCVGRKGGENAAIDKTLKVRRGNSPSGRLDGVDGGFEGLEAEGGWTAEIADDIEQERHAAARRDERGGCQKTRMNGPIEIRARTQCVQQGVGRRLPRLQV